MDVLGVVCALITLYIVLIVIRVVLSYFPLDPNGGAAAAAGFIYFLTDPILRPLRRAIPPVRLGSVALDLSTMIVIFGLIIIQNIIGC